MYHSRLFCLSLQHKTFNNYMLAISSNKLMRKQNMQIPIRTHTHNYMTAELGKNQNKEKSKYVHIYITI